MSFLEYNLKLFKKKYPNKIQNHTVTIQEEHDFIISRTGLPTAKYGNLYIHSPFDPQKESLRLIHAECRDSIDTCLFYGFGLGYHIEAFTQEYPEANIIIIDPDFNFFLKALSVRDFSNLLSHPRINWFFNQEPEELKSLLNLLPTDNLKIIRLRAIYQKNSEYFYKIDTIVQSFLSQKEININTLKRFSKLWVKNLFYNMRLFARAPGIKLLENMFTKVPAIVLASGPSLNDILSLLPRIKKKLLIICVDTSLRACLDTGIEPDFIVTVDPQYWNTRHLDRLKPLKSILISESSTNPLAFRTLKLKTFFISSFFPLGKYFESIIGEKGLLGAGGSVATTAWDFARHLGCPLIYMAGLDLGYPSSSTHYKGAFFETEFHNLSDRFLPAAHMSFNYLHHADSFPVKSNSGDTLLTDKRMIIFNWWFENQLKSKSSSKTFNLSKFGAAVKGMEYKPVESLLNFPEKRQSINHIFKEIVQIFSNSDNGEKEKLLLASLSKLKKDFKKLKNTALQGCHIIMENNYAMTNVTNGLMTNGLINELDHIDKAILSTGSRQIVSFLLQPIIHEYRKEKINKEKNENVLQASLKLYREIAEASEYHMGLIDRIKV